MPREGLEPTLPCGKRILSPSRLPFRHLGLRFPILQYKREIHHTDHPLVQLTLEATGGFEPPNRGFADPRLRPLGYVAIFDFWCRGGDLNSYAFSGTAPSRQRVYRFHHLGPPETFVGRGARIRTPDLRFWRPLLYQLSYTPRLYLDQLQVAISPSKYSIENQVFTPVEGESWKCI